MYNLLESHHPPSHKWNLSIIKKTTTTLGVKRSENSLPILLTLELYVKNLTLALAFCFNALPFSPCFANLSFSFSGFLYTFSLILNAVIESSIALCLQLESISKAIYLTALFNASTLTKLSLSVCFLGHFFKFRDCL